MLKIVSDDYYTTRFTTTETGIMNYAAENDTRIMGVTIAISTILYLILYLLTSVEKPFMHNQIYTHDVENELHSSQIVSHESWSRRLTAILLFAIARLLKFCWLCITL